MSLKWYPVIDIEDCISCGTCVDFCKHNVYAMKNGRPVVVSPNECIQGCKGCEPKCPQGAISHVGDISKNDNKGCCCNNGCC